MYQQGILRAAPRAYGRGVDNRAEVREFLVSRRAKVTPDQAGLPAGTNRRVPGLRRTEVALLAGISIEYYPRLGDGTTWLELVTDDEYHRP